MDDFTMPHSHGMTPDELTVIDLAVEARARFIQRTYLHLFGAIGAFTLLLVFLFQQGHAASIAGAVGRNYLPVFAAFLIVGWGASHLAHRARSLGVQYLALGTYVVIEAIIFVPLLYLADRLAPGVIANAVVVTLIGFGALTAVVFVTRKDFSFLRGFLLFGGVCALLLIGGSLLLGFTLGLFFFAGMVVLAGASILYGTSNVLHHFPEDRYVGAALELFSSVALLFWYVLRIFLAARD